MDDEDETATKASAKSAKKGKFQDRKGAGDRKANMMSEIYQRWDGDKAARGPRM